MGHPEIERGAGGRFRRTDGQPGRRTQKAAAETPPPSTLGALARAEASPKDTNLPDEQAGEEVGRLLPGERSQSDLKQRYRDAQQDRPTSGNPRWPDVIFGGDPDDPRWADYKRRQTLQGQAERAGRPFRDPMPVGGRGGR